MLFWGFFSYKYLDVPQNPILIIKAPTLRVWGLGLRVLRVWGLGLSVSTVGEVDEKAMPQSKNLETPKPLN